MQTKEDVSALTALQMHKSSAGRFRGGSYGEKCTYVTMSKATKKIYNFLFH